MAMPQQYNDHHGEGNSDHLHLILDLDPELSKLIQFAATRNRQTVYKYVEGVLKQAVSDVVPAKETRGKLNAEAINELLRMSDEIMEAHPDVIYDSVETLHQLREERDRELEQR